MSIVDSIDYTKILPMAVESRSRRRGFVPSNGSVFVSSSNNIIEIPVSAAAFLDTKHSFLRFTLNNTSGQTFGVDFGGGHSFINRLRVLQGGNVLSDCREYNRLMSAIILPCQSEESLVGTRSIREGVRFANSAVAGGAGVLAPAGAAAEITGACINTPTNANDSTAAVGGSYVFSVPLMNGLLGTTQDKLVPLFLLNNAPILIEITLENVANRVGTFGAGVTQYTIQDVRYMASLVETGPEVENQIRMVQQASGGRLVLNGVDYIHHPGNVSANARGRLMLPMPVRKKSIKSVLFACQSTSFAAQAQNVVYDLSHSGSMNIVDYQLVFGSKRIPQIPIRLDSAGTGLFDNKSEVVEELAKCFGTTKSAHGLGVISRINWGNQNGTNATMPNASAGGAAMRTHRFCPFGIDTEAFQPDGKGGGALESGIDTASDSTPLYLAIDVHSATNEAFVVDMYAVCDTLYIIDQVGNLRTAL